MGTSTLTYSRLAEAVVGRDIAIRVVTRLQPVGGPGDKVFPPTYPGGRDEATYAIETRRLADGRVVDCVVLDSAQSQANRFEEALQEAYDRGLVKFPLLQVDFTPWYPEIGRITSLQAPHRVADAIFRDSLLDGLPWRRTEPGRRFEAANIHNAAVLYEICPTALLFGSWDSHGVRGGSGNKFARVLTSEIVAFDVHVGVRTTSRIDPLAIERGDVYRNQDAELTANPDKGEKKKPSDIGHGNIAPNIVRTGGVTMDYAAQTTVLGLPGLRRLKFPAKDGSVGEPRNQAAQTVLAALALLAISLNRESGYELRSRCILAPVKQAPMEIIAADGQTEECTLDAKEALALFEEAVQAAEVAGIHWEQAPLELVPSEALLQLVGRNRPTEEGTAPAPAAQSAR